MMDCKRALTETGGDLDEAVKFLRSKGLAAAAKKAHRTAGEGTVVVVGDDKTMVVLELNCETDFVARNPEFQSFAEALATQALESAVDDAEALRQQPMAGDPEHTVEQAISTKIATIGENIILSRLARIEASEGGLLNFYVHGGGNIGVVVEGAGGADAEALHDVALHVAATDPRFVNRDEVTEELLATEREIALKQAIDSGKPEEIAQRIVHGKMEKFFEREVLLEQAFAKDPSLKVGEYLKKAAGDDATVVRFFRFKLGEGSGE
ncbi:MAG: translation elongation factor Ts [Thermoanaerobaculales bacterium]